MTFYTGPYLKNWEVKTNPVPKNFRLPLDMPASTQSRLGICAETLCKKIKREQIQNRCKNTGKTIRYKNFPSVTEMHLTMPSTIEVLMQEKKLRNEMKVAS